MGTHPALAAVMAVIVFGPMTAAGLCVSARWRAGMRLVQEHAIQQDNYTEYGPHVHTGGACSWGPDCPCDDQEGA